VCQSKQAKKVLDENMSVSTALPCRISIYEEGGKNHAGDIETNRSFGDVQGAEIGRSGTGSGGHDCENHERGCIWLIGMTCT
jgi:hypothetical protein